MLAHIANFLGGIVCDEEDKRVSEQGVIAIEGGTGTGKTVAYLLSVLSLARKAGKKVVIATGTVALQGQLLQRDIPDVIAATGWSCKLALAKGRGRYLCPLRLQQCAETAKAKSAGLFLFEDEQAFLPDAQSAVLLESMTSALQDGEWDGDRDSWPEAVPAQTWQALSVDRNQCAGRRCRLISECCFFKARESLEGADCIVANHDLVMADLSLGGGAILSAPEDTIYVFDEAHRLGGTALNHFASQCRIKATSQWLEQMQKSIKAMAVVFEKMPDVTQRGVELSGIAHLACPLLLQALAHFEGLLQAEGDNESRYRYPDGKIDESSRAVSEDLTAIFVRLNSRMENLHSVLEDAMEDNHPPVPRVDIEQYFQAVGQWLGRSNNATELWLAMTHADPAGVPPMARWLSLEDSGDIRLSVSPISAGQRLNELLWQRCYGAIATSATLRVLGDFERFKRDSGLAPDTPCELVPGAFDYQRAGLLVVPDIGADGGNARAHTEALIEHLPDLLGPDLATDNSAAEQSSVEKPAVEKSATEKGGVLVLFSSRRQMEDLVSGIADAVPWQLLVQGELSTAEIISRHRACIDEGGRSVIFGLASFAEGMDLPGAYCEHVIIAKLPFAVPSDPLQAALAEWVESQGGNAFRDITLPDTALRLVQACGRLLRHEGDTGRVTILDRRIASKYYGRQLLASLPPFRQQID